MKVKELIEELTQYDPELEVIMQKDAEGNGYSPCCGTCGDAVYIAETDWSGEAYDTTLTAEEMDLEEDEWNKIKSNPQVVLIFPVN